MNLDIYLNLIHSDWYVGELYLKLASFIKNIPGINAEVKNLTELSKKINVSWGYSNNYPSVVNPYNLIIQNRDNEKTFIHSFNDYAPVILEKESGIDKLDVVKFACVSRLNQQVINNFKDKLKIQPSIYILELLSEHSLIETYRKEPKTIPKVYFNGACYGIRENYYKILEQSDIFHFRNKHLKGFYLTKQQYYEELSKYQYGFNLDGAAKICYRDLECFGMGVLLFREPLDVLTFEPLIDGVNYINIIDEDILSKINIKEHAKYIKEKMETKVFEIIRNRKQVDYIIHESRAWFERNCLPDNQVKILFSFLEDFEIFK